jgi:IQ calmodulin-binding motif
MDLETEEEIEQLIRLELGNVDGEDLDDIIENENDILEKRVNNEQEQDFINLQSLISTSSWKDLIEIVSTADLEDVRESDMHISDLDSISSSSRISPQISVEKVTNILPDCRLDSEQSSVFLQDLDLTYNTDTHLQYVEEIEGPCLHADNDLAPLQDLLEEERLLEDMMDKLNDDLTNTLSQIETEKTYQSNLRSQISVIMSAKAESKQIIRNNIKKRAQLEAHECHLKSWLDVISVVIRDREILRNDNLMLMAEDLKKGPFSANKLLQERLQVLTTDSEEQKSLLDIIIKKRDDLLAEVIRKSTEMAQQCLELKQLELSVEALRDKKTKFLLVSHNIIITQSIVRRYLVRKMVRKWNLAASIIQSTFRKFITRKTLIAEKQKLAIAFIEIRNAASRRIQRCYRSYKKRCHLLYTKANEVKSIAELEMEMEFDFEEYDKEEEEINEWLANNDFNKFEKSMLSILQVEALQAQAITPRRKLSLKLADPSRSNHTMKLDSTYCGEADTTTNQDSQSSLPEIELHLEPLGRKNKYCDDYTIPDYSGFLVPQSLNNDYSGFLVPQSLNNDYDDYAAREEFTPPGGNVSSKAWDQYSIKTTKLAKNRHARLLKRPKEQEHRKVFKIVKQRAYE